MSEIPKIHQWVSVAPTDFCVECGNARDYIGHQMYEQIFNDSNALQNERDIYREIAINSEMQWRKLHGEVVPYIQREAVENYIDTLVKEHQKRPWSKLNEK